MYHLNIHNVTKVEFQVTKLFNNFSSRNLVVTTTDSSGNENSHTIGFYGGDHEHLIPIVSSKVSHHYTEDDNDYSGPDT